MLLPKPDSPALSRSFFLFVCFFRCCFLHKLLKLKRHKVALWFQVFRISRSPFYLIHPHLNCSFPPLLPFGFYGKGLEGWRRKWQPTPVFLPGKFRGQQSLEGQSPWCHTEGQGGSGFRSETLESESRALGTAPQVSRSGSRRGVVSEHPGQPVWSCRALPW